MVEEISGTEGASSTSNTVDPALQIAFDETKTKYESLKSTLDILYPDTSESKKQSIESKLSAIESLIISEASNEEIGDAIDEVKAIIDLLEFKSNKLEILENLHSIAKIAITEESSKEAELVKYTEILDLLKLDELPPETLEEIDKKLRDFELLSQGYMVDGIQLINAAYITRQNQIKQDINSFYLRAKEIEAKNKFGLYELKNELEAKAIEAQTEDNLLTAESKRNEESLRSKQKNEHDVSDLKYNDAKTREFKKNIIKQSETLVPEKLHQAENLDSSKNQRPEPSKQASHHYPQHIEFKNSSHNKALNSENHTNIRSSKPEEKHAEVKLNTIPRKSDVLTPKNVNQVEPLAAAHSKKPYQPPPAEHKNQNNVGAKNSEEINLNDSQDKSIPIAEQIETSNEKKKQNLRLKVIENSSNFNRERDNLLRNLEEQEKNKQRDVD